MATFTRSQLITQVLDNLGVIAYGQTPSGEDVAKVDGMIDAATDELNGLDIIYIDDVGLLGPADGNIDGAVFLSLADMIAARVAGPFGLSDDAALDVKARRAEKMLRTIARPARARQTLRTDAQLRGSRTWPGRGSYSNGT